MASGGDDKKVQLWRMNRLNSPLSTLAGNQSGVVSVTFDVDELNLVTGSSGGSVKVYDLAENKISRSLNGHLAAVGTVAYHPYGEFIASGSDDTNMKVWDIRHKSCIQTYKGHTKSVNTVKFSPDGQWLASSSKDGTIKIWDLIAGKQLHSFQVSEEGSMCPTNFEFNPSEFLLAAVSGDSTVKFFDMESFECIFSTPKDPSRVLNIVFNDNQLLSATNDGIRAWEWEPKMKCCRSADNRWGGLVGDMVVNEANQLVVGSFSYDSVGVWAVDLEALPKRAPPCGPVFTPTNPSMSNMSNPNNHKINISNSNSSNSNSNSNSNRNVRKTSTSSSSTTSSFAEPKNDFGFNIVGKSVVPHSSAKATPEKMCKQQPHSPTTPTTTTTTITNSPPSTPISNFAKHLSDDFSPSPSNYYVESPRHEEDSKNDESDYYFDQSPPEHIVIVDSPVSADVSTSSQNNYKTELRSNYDFASAMGAATPYSCCSSSNASPNFKRPPPSPRDLEDAVEAASSVLKGGGNIIEREKKPPLPPSLSLSPASQPFNIDAILPRGQFNNKRTPPKQPQQLQQLQQLQQPQQPHPQPSPEMDDDQIIGQILLGRLGLSVCLSQRLEKLKKMKKMWKKGNVVGCMEFCKKIVESDDDGSMEEMAVVADFLKAIKIRSNEVMRLDVCAILLDVLCTMILGIGVGNKDKDKDKENELETTNTFGGSGTTLKGKPHATIAMNCTSTIIECFGRQVYDNVTGKSGGGGFGVDMAWEERREKYTEMHDVLVKLSNRICLEEDGEEGGQGGLGGSKLQFLGLVDVKDLGARKAASKVQSLLMKYERGQL